MLRMDFNIVLKKCPEGPDLLEISFGLEEENNAVHSPCS